MSRANFDVYKLKVSIETRLGTREFELLPLSGRFYKKLISVISKFPQEEGLSNSAFLESLDEDTVGKIHELCFETLRHSERVTEKEDLEKLDFFVSQNLFQLLPALVDVNIGSKDKE